MYVSIVLCGKCSFQSIALVALKSCCCSSKVFIHGEEVQSSDSSLQNKDEPLLMRRIWETTKNKTKKPLKPIINCQNILQNITIFML